MLGFEILQISYLKYLAILETVHSGKARFTPDIIKVIVLKELLEFSKL